MVVGYCYRFLLVFGCGQDSGMYQHHSIVDMAVEDVCVYVVCRQDCEDRTLLFIIIITPWYTLAVLVCIQLLSTCYCSLTTKPVSYKC